MIGYLTSCSQLQLEDSFLDTLVIENYQMNIDLWKYGLKYQLINYLSWLFSLSVQAKVGLLAPFSCGRQCIWLCQRISASLFW